MKKTVYFIPDTHKVSERYAGEKAMEMIQASEDFRRTKNPAKIKLLAGSYLIDEKSNFTRKDFPIITDFLSKNLGVGSYKTEAKIIEDSKPDVLFVESFTSEKEIFEQLPYVETVYLIGALKEGKNIFATRAPVYEICKKLKTPVVPIDSKELMEEIWKIDKKEQSFKGDRKSKKFQDIEIEFKEIIKNRSEFMLNEISKGIDGLGQDKIYVALVGSQHYENMKISERDVDILHINKRLEALGLNERYNE